MDDYNKATVDCKLFEAFLNVGVSRSTLLYFIIYAVKTPQQQKNKVNISSQPKTYNTAFVLNKKLLLFISQVRLNCQCIFFQFN